MGKGAVPLCSLWDGERLGYVEARARIYIPLYVEAVKKTDAFHRLKQLYEQMRSLILFDFDGWDHDRLNLSLRDVLHCTERKMGHAFVLKAMLLYGEDFRPEFLP